MFLISCVEQAVLSLRGAGVDRHVMDGVVKGMLSKRAYVRLRANDSGFCGLLAHTDFAK